MQRIEGKINVKYNVHIFPNVREKFIQSRNIFNKISLVTVRFINMYAYLIYVNNRILYGVMEQGKLYIVGIWNDITLFCTHSFIYCFGDLYTIKYTGGS